MIQLTDKIYGDLTKLEKIQALYIDALADSTRSDHDSILQSYAVIEMAKSGISNGRPIKYKKILKPLTSTQLRDEVRGMLP